MEQLDILSKPVIVEGSPQLAGAVRSEGQSIDNAFQHIFKTRGEESRVQKARQITRQIIGAAVIGLSDEELEVYLSEFQHLIDE
jgi:hypothetical protein